MNVNIILLETILDISSNFASVIGLIISIYLLFGIKNLRKQFQFRGRVPKIRKGLEKEVKSLNKYMGSFAESKDDIHLILRRVETILKSLEKKVKGDSKNYIANLRTELKKLFRRDTKINKFFKRQIPFTYNNVWNIYCKIHAIIEDLKLKLEDYKWGDQ